MTAEEAEQQFLRERQRPGHPDVGASSVALVRVAFHGGEPDHWPRDNDDLARCERTFAKAPPHLQERMRPWLAKFADHVAHKRAQREGRSFGPHVAGTGAVAKAFAASNEMPDPGAVASRMASAAREAVDVRPSAVEGVPPAPQISEESREREEREARRAERDRLDVDWLVYRWTELKPKIPTDERVEVPEPVLTDAFRLLRDARVLRNAIRDITQLGLLADVLADIERTLGLDDSERTLGLEHEERAMNEEITPGGESGPQGPAKSLDIAQLTLAIKDGDADKAAQLARELAEANRVPDFVAPLRTNVNVLDSLLRKLEGHDVTTAPREDLVDGMGATVRRMADILGEQLVGTSAEKREIQRLERRIADAHAVLVSRSHDSKATKAILHATIVAALNILSGAPR